MSGWRDYFQEFCRGDAVKPNPEAQAAQLRKTMYEAAAPALKILRTFGGARGAAAIERIMNDHVADWRRDHGLG